MTLPVPLRLRLRALFRAVTVSFLRCCFCCRRAAASLVYVLVWETATYGELAGLAAPQLTNTLTFVVRARTHMHKSAYTHEKKKTHALLVFVSTPWYVCVCVCVRVCTVYVCGVFNESTTKNGRNVFCFYPSAVDVGFFGRWPLAHTHLQIPAHTHARSRIHAHDRRSISFDICNFHFSVRIMSRVSN